MALLPQLVRPIADVVWPQTCTACGELLPADRGRLCSHCQSRLDHLCAIPYCPRCGRSASPLATDATGCPGCRQERFWNHRGLVRIGPYQPPLRDWLLAIKYGRDRRALRQVADRLAGRLRAAAWFEQIDVIVPVPMHWLRRLDRPWDHAVVLAREVAVRVGRPLVRAVRKRVHTPSLVGAATTRAQRFQLVRGSFAPARTRKTRDATVCVIDNVVVTGATLHEVCRTLRRAGVRRIYAAVACRPVGGGDWDPSVEPLVAGAALPST